MAAVSRLARPLRSPVLRHAGRALFTVLLLFALLPLAPAAPVKAATQPQISNNGSTTINYSSSDRSSATFSHTVPAGNQRLLVVIIHMEGTRDVTSVTYSGQSLTRAIRQNSGNTSRGQIQIWYLVSPPTGTANVVVTYSGVQDWDGITVLNYVGVAQTSPVGATAGRTLTTISTTQSVSITTTVANSMVIGGVVTPGSTGDPFTPLANVTERADYDTGGGGGAGSDGSCFAGEANRPSTGAFTFGATSSASLRGTIACVEFKPADPDIASTGETNHNFGLVDPDTSYSTGLTRWTVTNNSGFAVNITIQGTDMTGGTAWTLSDTATPGADTYGLKAGLFGGSYSIIVRKNAPYNTLKSNLAAGASQQWGLQLLTPTEFSDAVQKTGTVTLTATAV